jgi:RNA polymerase sigma-70 factor (ECF subfamily)
LETAVHAERLATSDDALVRRARLGDAAAFDRLAATRLDRCYRLAWSILLNDADAADATQDGFVMAWRELPRLRDAGAFDGWLNRIIANAARMLRRHRGRLREIQVHPLASTDLAPMAREMRTRPAPSPEIEAVADADAIGRAFDRLRPEARAILVLHHLEGRPLSEIAASLGIRLGTLKWRLHEARRALEKALEAEA